jgi:hypothetical protein
MSCAEILPSKRNAQLLAYGAQPPAQLERNQ